MPKRLCDWNPKTTTSLCRSSSGYDLYRRPLRWLRRYAKRLLGRCFRGDQAKALPTRRRRSWAGMPGLSLMLCGRGFVRGTGPTANQALDTLPMGVRVGACRRGAYVVRSEHQRGRCWGHLAKNGQVTFFEWLCAHARLLSVQKRLHFGLARQDDLTLFRNMKP